MNFITLNTAAQGGGLASMFPLLMLVVMFAVLYFFMIRPQKKKQKEPRSEINAPFSIFFYREVTP